MANLGRTVLMWLNERAFLDPFVGLWFQKSPLGGNQNPAASRFPDPVIWNFSGFTKRKPDINPP
jgi:hypothetical protein